MIIAIDGPAGSGKTTIAKILAERLGIFYLDTGATYRALTFKAIEKGLRLSDQESLVQLAENLNLEFKNEKVYLNGTDVSNEIRMPLINKNISPIAALSGVREIMVNLQRKLAQKGDCVVEGRDITTVVFPDAEYKFYLDADPDIRVKRRFKELKEKGLSVNYQENKEDLEKRDYADKNRSIGALRISENAEVIDTTGLTIEEVVEAILKSIK